MAPDAVRELLGRRRPRPRRRDPQPRAVRRRGGAIPARAIQPVGACRFRRADGHADLQGDVSCPGGTERFALEAAAESSRTAFGSDVNAGAAMFNVRAFRRVLGPHTVLAARAAIASAWGDVSARRVFSAAGPGPSYPVFDFGRDAVGLLRGFASEDVVGTRAAVLNLDLRFPIARPQRGSGSWPLFLHSIHGAAFIDAAHAWDTTFHAADIKSSIGVELSADIVAVHYLPLTIAAGTAWTRDPIIDRRRAAVFGRIGYAF